MASSLEALKQPSLLALRLRVFPRPYLRLSWASKVVSTLAIHSGQGLASTRAPSRLFCRRTELGNGAGSFPSVLQSHHRRCQPQEMLTAVKQVRFMTAVMNCRIEGKLFPGQTQRENLKQSSTQEQKLKIPQKYQTWIKCSWFSTQER